MLLNPSIQLLCLCLPIWGVLARGVPTHDRFYLLRDLLEKIDDILHHESSIRAEKRQLKDSNQLPASLEQLVDDINWHDVIQSSKRGPPGGFSPARGKRPSSDYEPIFDETEQYPLIQQDKRFPSGSDFFGVRGKKDDGYYYDEDKRFPGNGEFFGARGKKSWVDDEYIKRIPMEGHFLGVRGKKSSDGNKRMPMPGDFFGARGKKDGAKRMPSANDFYGARGKKNGLEEFKRVSANDFFGARGKKSDFSDIDDFKRTLSNDFFGSRGKRSGMLTDEFIGARGKRDLRYNNVISWKKAAERSSNVISDPIEHPVIPSRKGHFRMKRSLG